MTINRMEVFFKVAAKKKENKTMSMEIYGKYAAYDTNAISSAKKERKAAIAQSAQENALEARFELKA